MLFFITSFRLAEERVLFLWLQGTVALTNTRRLRWLLCVGIWRRVCVNALLNKAYGNPKKPQQQWNKTTNFKDFKSYLFT
jgi:hypothetical protein